eukprot:scaffold25158_cov65-Phaeocystis_antarctica.AAC.5
MQACTQSGLALGSASGLRSAFKHLSLASRSAARSAAAAAARRAGLPTYWFVSLMFRAALIMKN